MSHSSRNTFLQNFKSLNECWFSKSCFSRIWYPFFINSKTNSHKYLHSKFMSSIILKVHVACHSKAPDNFDIRYFCNSDVILLWHSTKMFIFHLTNYEKLWQWKIFCQLTWALHILAVHLLPFVELLNIFNSSSWLYLQFS